MLESTLSRDSACAKETSAPESGDGEAPRRRKKRYRAAGCPKGVPVLRAALRDPRLCRTDAIVLALFVWLGEHEGEVSITRVAEWLRCHRTTVSRSARKLRKLKFLDRDHQPLARWQSHFQPRRGQKRISPGFVYFSFETLSLTDGRKETVAFQALASFGELKEVHTDAKGRMEVPGKLFATVIGVKSEKTALNMLAGLSEKSLIRVHRTKGHAARVELVPERDRKPSPAGRKVKPTKAPKPRVGEPAKDAAPAQPTADEEMVARAAAAIDNTKAIIAASILREQARKAEQLAKKAAKEQRAQSSP